MAIGYVVSELCEEVHSAFSSNSIVSVEFAWVKYKLWKKAPGYYAAINITRKGEWSKKIKNRSSTFFKQRIPSTTSISCNNAHLVR